MLALEMLGRRAHNDHPNNFSRSPPYTEDVKWLLGLAARLGDCLHFLSHVHHLRLQLDSFLEPLKGFRRVHRSTVFAVLAGTGSYILLAWTCC